MADVEKTRYSTTLTYENGKRQKVTKNLVFELDPLEFLDWSINNRFSANELQSGLEDIRNAGLEKLDRDLRPDEIATLLNIIKVLVDLSAGKPDDDGEYFVKDPNWTSSYAYRGFRRFLLENPVEMNKFTSSLLDNDVMEKFTASITQENTSLTDQNSDNNSETVEKMRAKIAELEAANQAKPSDEA